MGDKLFTSSRILCGDGSDLFSGGVLVSLEDGKIKSVLRSDDAVRNYLANNPSIQKTSFGDHVIMPGLIDSHVHINEPGRTEWEGFTTATKAAAAGGFTTIVDMPLNSIPATTTLNNLNLKIVAAESKCFVDMGFWGGVVPGNSCELLAMINRGVVGFKCFLCPSGVDEFPQAFEYDVDQALNVLQNTKSVLAFHAEVESGPCSCTGNPHAYSTYLASRPEGMEMDAIRLVLRQADLHESARIHIVHLSAADALPLFEEARARNRDITVETCHHYLTLTSEEIPDCHTEFKSAPPVRNQENRLKLWDGVVKGQINMIVSDHSPSTPDMKLLDEDNPDRGDFLKAWGGISSLQFGLSLFWTECRQFGMQIQDVPRLMSQGPAKLCGFNGFKGVIQEGFDADFCIWDPEESVCVNPDMIEFRNKANPYMGKEFKGKVYETVLRGNSIYKANDGVCSDAMGKLLIN